MRTKTLLLTAATVVAGLVSSQADTVYSQNIVGYVNQMIPGGNAFSLLTPPLKGTNTTANAEELLPALEAGDNIYLWTGTGYDIETYLSPGTWLNSAGDVVGTPTITPGVGFYYQNAGSTKTNTYTGTVVQTNSVTLLGGNGFSLVGSALPIGGGIESTNINIPFTSGDNVYFWTGTGYDIETYLSPGTWLNGAGDVVGEPTISVGQGFFYQNSSTTTNWVQSYKAQ